MGSQLKVSFDRLDNRKIKPATPGLQGKWFIHYTIADRKGGLTQLITIWDDNCCSKKVHIFQQSSSPADLYNC